MTPDPRPTARPGDRTRNRLLAAAAAILVILALRLSRPVTMPLALGLTMAALAWPIQRRLSRHAPGWVGVLAAVLALVLGLLALLAALGWSADELVDRGGRYQDRVAERRAQAAAVAGRFGVDLPAAGGGSGQGGDAEGGGPSPASRFGRALYESLGSLGLALGFAALALAEVDAVRARVRRRLAPDTARRALDVASEVTGAVRRYFAVKTFTSLLTGAATALYALAVGLDLAALWGLLAFLLEYVPSIGSLIAVVPPTVFAFLQFEGVARPLAIGAGLGALQLVLGNFVDPKIEGHRMSVSPLVVLLSIVFWAWVWGPFGALLGVPMTVALTILAHHFPGTRWAWAVLTEESRSERAERGQPEARPAERRASG